MGSSEAYDCNRRSRRRNEDKRRRVEVAVVRLGPTPESGKALSEGIYRLYRNLVAQKSLDDQDRYYREWQSRAERKLAERTAIASGADTDLLAYVADVRELAARMDHLESLERRNLGRGKAIEQASKVTWADLSPQERRKAQQYLSQNVRPGDKTRRPAREAEFLGSVAALIEQATGSLRGLIDRIVLTPVGGGLCAELHGDLAVLARFAHMEKGRAEPNGGPERLSVVAGVGFEPTTFRLRA
jgi:hypothetical protein